MDKMGKQSYKTGRLNRIMAEWTGLEPATSGVTGRHSNQLNYHSALVLHVEVSLNAACILRVRGK